MLGTHNESYMSRGGNKSDSCCVWDTQTHIDNIDNIQLRMRDPVHPQTHLEMPTQVLVTDRSRHSSVSRFLSCFVLQCWK